MKISVSWINDLLNSHLSPEEVADYLTSSGLEVEEIEPFDLIPGGLQHVVLGKVLEALPHPNADKLRLCTVDAGEEAPRQIVCGAPNVAQGQTVVVALPGATLYPNQGEPFTIKKSKIRGEVSLGMICAEDELGLGSSHEGIMVLETELASGSPAAQYFSLETDHILTVNITPNRPDGASHVGACRDIVAKAFTQGKSYEMPDFPRAFHPLTGTGTGIGFEVVAEEDCGRYTGITLTGLRMGPSPKWLAQRLKAIGLKPQNAVVDVTNYVMFLLGHPLHAFDADKIEGGKIVVRKAKKGEHLRTLDDIDRALSEDDLVIADAQNAMCLAGVFGGKHSGVSEQTTRVFIESAWFNPASIRKTAKRHGLHTDASFRFERGCDPAIIPMALRIAARMIMEILQGEPEGDELDQSTKGMPAPKFVPFEMPYLHRLAGVEIPDTEASEILRLLGFEGEMERHSSWRLKVPGFRPDVHRPADVAEEILRIYGFDRIPLEGHLDIRINRSMVSERDRLKEQTAAWLSARGFSEAVHLSMLPQDLAEAAYPDQAKYLVTLKNPLSRELAVMRPGLLPGLLQTVARNVHHRNLNLRLFEFGRSYLSREPERFQEEEYLALVASGESGPEHWLKGSYSADIYEMKGWVKSLLDQAGIQGLMWETTDALPWTGHGVVVRTRKDGKLLASLGWVSPDLTKMCGIKQMVYYAEVHWPLLKSLVPQGKVKLKPLPKFPAMRRDLALLVPHDMPFEKMEAVIKKQGGKQLESWQLFDVYQGKGVSEGFVSMAIGLVFRDAHRTLRDEEAEKATDRLLQALNDELGVRLRA